MANIITAVRIVCSLVLIFCRTFSPSFYVVYIIAGISDVFDGIAARHSGHETKFGSRLDTIADILFASAVILKTVQSVNIPVWLIIWIVCIAIIKCVNIIIGFIIHKRLCSEHTVMNKICGVLLFFIPLGIVKLPWQLVALQIIMTCGAATFAAIQEGHYIIIGKEIL